MWSQVLALCAKAVALHEHSTAVLRVGKRATGVIDSDIVRSELSTSGASTGQSSHFDGMATYPANRDARAGLTQTESVNYGRVHRLDRISRLRPAKLFDYRALTLSIKVQTVWPV